jgi:hypothetical protein
MFSATLQKLRKPLTAESKLGFSNSAVIGGLDAYMCGELERALQGIVASSTPHEAEFRLQRLLTLWQRYADSDIMERRNIVQESVRLLEELQAEFSSPAFDEVVPAPKEDAPTASEERQRHYNK